MRKSKPKRKVDPKAVARRIREIRGAVPQEKFFALIGLRRQSVLSRYETGRRMPGPAVLVRLSDYSGLSVDYILTGKEVASQAEERVA